MFGFLMRYTFYSRQSITKIMLLGLSTSGISLTETVTLSKVQAWVTVSKHDITNRSILI